MPIRDNRQTPFMKNLFLLAVTVLLFSNNGYAQQYVPMPTSDAIWTYHWIRTGSGTPSIHARGQLMLTGEDTVIKSLTYKKVIIRYFDTTVQGTYNLPYNIIANHPDQYFGAIREDNKRVYCYQYLGFPTVVPRGDTGESLYYDFSLDSGDMSPQGIITKIDSVQVGASYRKRFTTAAGSKLIEGIGSAQEGLMWFPSMMYVIRSFSCFAHQQITYSAPNDCSYIWPYGTPTSVSGMRPKNEIKIYPNPFVDELNIEAEGADKVIVYNSMGQAVVQEQIKNKTSLSTRNLEAGIYHAILLNETGEILHSQKILKQ